jgi:hypothetical protein
VQPYGLVDLRTPRSTPDTPITIIGANAVDTTGESLSYAASGGGSGGGSISASVSAGSFATAGSRGDLASLDSEALLRKISSNRNLGSSSLPGSKGSNLGSDGNKESRDGSRRQSFEEAEEQLWRNISSDGSGRQSLEEAEEQRWGCTAVEFS